MTRSCIVKFVEIRDRMTMIPAIAIQMVSSDPVEDRFLWRCGYPRGEDRPAVVLMRLADQRATSDPYEWADRTLMTAHLHVEEHFDHLQNGQVVDVCVLLGETAEAAPAEIALGARP